MKSPLLCLAACLPYLGVWTTAQSPLQEDDADIAQKSVRMGECLARMYMFDLQVEQFDKYNTTYFRDNSTMTLAQAGTYYKADGIEEYTKYVQRAGQCVCTSEQ